MSKKSKPNNKRVRTNKNNKKVKVDLARIKVVGVGGAGGKIISRIAQRKKIKGVKFIAINTDIQDLNHLGRSRAAKAIQKVAVGQDLTHGLGAGMNPELGQQAVEESRQQISELLKGANIVFVVAGLGGGTGSFGSSVVADISKQQGILTIGVVTKPFSFEGLQRKKIADQALEKLSKKVDTLIVIPNDRIFKLVDRNTSLIKAFRLIDDVLKDAISSIVEVIVSTGLINLDLADIKVIMSDGGPALVGTGLAYGSQRAVKAASLAINSPLLETSIEGARGVLFCVSGRKDLKLSEVNTVAKMITENVNPGAKIIFGAYYDQNIRKDGLKVTLIATKLSGIRQDYQLTKEPEPLFSDEFQKSKPKSIEISQPTELEKKLEKPAFLRRKR